MSKVRVYASGVDVTMELKTDDDVIQVDVDGKPTIGILASGEVIGWPDGEQAETLVESRNS